MVGIWSIGTIGLIGTIGSIGSIGTIGSIGSIGTIGSLCLTGALVKELLLTPNSVLLVRGMT